MDSITLHNESAKAYIEAMTIEIAQELKNFAPDVTDKNQKKSY